MTWVAVAIGGSALVGAYSANKAAGVQADVAGQGMAVQQGQFDALQANMQPYMEAGKTALSQQQALMGVSGPEAQQAAIAALQASPQMQAMQLQGEQGILQNASATGGLRGGNVQGALAQFRPNMLNQLIQQQMGNLGGMASLGQNAAAGVGNAGMGMATNVGNLLQQQGAAQAGGIMGQSNYLNQGLGTYLGYQQNQQMMKALQPPQAPVPTL